MSNGLTLAEWKEIEEFLKLTPRCKLDKTGIVWMHDEEGNTTGALHAHTFLDIMREVGQKPQRCCPHPTGSHWVAPDGWIVCNLCTCVKNDHLKRPKA